MDVITAEKQHIRRLMLVKRHSMTLYQVQQASDIITQRVMKMCDWHSAARVHIYKSVAAWREVQADQLIQELLDNYPHLEIVVQGTDPDQSMPTEKFDHIIVPVVAFDNQGNRIGMGKGWYDRFLAAQPHAITIGLAYAWAEQTFIPHEPHDVPLSLVVSG